MCTALHNSICEFHGEPYYIQVDPNYHQNTALLGLYQFINKLHSNNNLKIYKLQVYWRKSTTPLPDSPDLSSLGKEQARKI